MRRLSSAATRLFLSSLVGVGKVVSSDAATDFYFETEDWTALFSKLGYTIEPAHPMIKGQESPAGNITTSIVNLDAISQDALQFIFNRPSSFSFQNAILVDASTKGTLAVGYDTSGSPDSGITLPQFPINWQSETGSLTLDADVLKAIIAGLDSAVLFFQIGWLEGGTSDDEYGSSPAWAIAKQVSAAASIYSSLSLANTYLDLTSTQPAVFAPAATPYISLSVLPTAGSGQTETARSITQVTASPTSTTSSTSSSTQSKASSAKAALSTGAIVGIVVGAIVGIVVGAVAALALLLLAAALCLRRKRRQARASQRDTQDLMLAEKEARAAAPDTPYSEDNGPRLGGFESAGAAAAVGGVLLPRGGGEGTESAAASQRGSVVQSSLRNVTNVGSNSNELAAGSSPTDTHRASVSLHDGEPQEQQQPVHRRPLSEATTAADLVSPSSDAAAAETERSPLAPPPVGSARFARVDTPGAKSISDYLHEDGMTADEIRRLEEEERALDEAIEQAGGRAGGGR